MDFEAYMSALAQKRVGVIGAGVSNRPLIEELLRRGAEVTVRDKREDLGEFGAFLAEKGCRTVLGADYLCGITEDVIFRSPGIRPDVPEFLDALARGTVLTSEMEAFFDVCPCKILAVTGSDGKTTTTTILSELLKEEGRRVHVGGNIGHPLLCDTPDIRPDDLVVLELSSFQLMTMEKSADIAVTTNLAPNHLDFHKDYPEYITAKENIFTHQSVQGIAVFNADNADSMPQAKKARGEVRLFSRKTRVVNGVFSENGVLYDARNGDVTPIMRTDEIKLPGVHNVENYMAAFAAARDLVSHETMRRVAQSFGGVEHRIELIRERNGVKWYNDSIASSPSRTIAGLRAFPNKVILIAGGKDKGISYDDLGPVVNDHVKLLILCGKTAGVIRQSTEQAENYAGLEIVDVSDYHEAVALADARAKSGDVVILSPASTSFDRFANFMERGNVFKSIVNALS